MTLFKFPHFPRKPTPVAATDMSLHSWRHQSLIQSTRFVQKVELCTALAMGVDARGVRVSENHHHALLRVSLVPTHNTPSTSADTLLIERVLSTRGSYHSVTPITDTFETQGTFPRLDIHDRVCFVWDGPSTALARDLVVERTLKFGDWATEPRLTLAEIAQILGFVSRTTKRLCDDGDCRFQSRSFAFTCLAALAPRLPPRESGEEVDTSFVCGTETDDDAVFELGAEAFLGQAPWLARGPASIQAVELIGSLKNDCREAAGARLYH